MTQPTTSPRSIGGIILLLAGSVLALFGLVLFAVAISLLVGGDFISGHPGGLFVLAQGVVLFVLGRWLFRVGLKVQNSVQGSKRQEGE